MLARRKGLERPFHMQMVRQRNIDGVDPRVGQQGVVAVMHFQIRAKGPKRSGLFAVRGGKRRKLCAFGGMDGRGHLLMGEFRCAKNTPLDWSGHGRPCFVQTDAKAECGKAEPVLWMTLDHVEQGRILPFQDGQGRNHPCPLDHSKPLRRNDHALAFGKFAHLFLQFLKRPHFNLANAFAADTVVG